MTNAIVPPRARQKVYVTAIDYQGNPVLALGRRLIKQYAPSKFTSVKVSEEADIVLYLENGYLGLAELPRLIDRVKTAPSAMHFMLSESDWPFPVLPGAYPSLSNAVSWAHSWSYLSALGRETLNEAEASRYVEPDLLFSFVGRTTTHQIRRKVLILDTPNTPCFDVGDGPKRFSHFDYSQTYIDIIRRSKFVLCPRGIGPSSIRIFEAMSMGRTPVVISDKWQPPPGIPWNEFCVLVPERDLAAIPEILNSLERKSFSMGERALEVYYDYFGPKVFFDRLLTTLLSKYASCSLTTPAIVQRAWQAIGWRELRTIFHQARTIVRPH
jgi:hypothetical protein